MTPIFCYKKVFLSYIVCNEWPVYKYFNSNDIKGKHSNTYLHFQNYCNTIKINV